MSVKFDLEQYLTNGAEDIVKELITAFFSNPAESRFMAGFAVSASKASKRRQKSAEKGQHIPPFLIASITSRCNLSCAGCYSRANKACSDDEPVQQLSADDWDSVFSQASDLGISFILLAGGEPLVRPDVIRAAGNHKDILFPIFTNGTMINERYAEIFAKNRNLVPVMSIEGLREKTDARRGQGVYDKLLSAMELMRKNSLIFGVSVTVTKENLSEVTSDSFIAELEKSGCRGVVYVEYVPADNESDALAPDDNDRQLLAERVDQLRQTSGGMLFLSFPGDEDTSDGCLAAGRGFFHINSHGGAEPCPFSPFSDINVRESSLLSALNSPLFMALQSEGLLKEEHSGGCVLHARRSQVEALLTHNL